MRRILTLGEQKPHAKEPPNAWVFRVLNLDPNDSSGLELRCDQDTLYCGVLGTALENCMRLDHIPLEIRLAVKSWMQFDGAKDDHTRSVSVVICNEHNSAILLQRKDLKHPNSAYRGRYSLFGGSPYVDEPTYYAALRELCEEIRSAELTKHLNKLLYVETILVESVQWLGTCASSIYRLRLPNDLFDKIVRNAAYQGNVSESVGVTMTRQEFTDILWHQECKEPGRHFVASHHLIIRRVLQPHLNRHIP